MFTKTNRPRIALISVLFLMLVAAVMFSQPAPASAASQVKAVDNSCLTCHEDLYYLHDTGSRYCITAHAERCVNCHEGNPAAVKMEDAHVGLILHPQENDGAKCRECHTEQDAQARLTQFAAADKFDTVIRPEAYTPRQPVELGLTQQEKINPLISNGRFVIGALVVFGLWLALVLFSPLKP